MRIWRLMAAAVALLCLCNVSAHGAPPPLSVYGSLPAFERASISPSGNHIAIVSTVMGKRMLLVTDATNKVIFKSSAGDLKIRGLDWVGDQSLLIEYSKTEEIYGFTTNKAELSMVAVVPINGGKIWYVLGNDSRISGGVWGIYGLVQRDGRWYGYFGGMTNDGHGGFPSGPLRPDLYEVDMQTGNHRLIAHRPEAGGQRVHWLIDSRGSIAATLVLLDRGDWSIRNSVQKVLATGKNPLGDISLDGFTADGTGLVYQRVDEQTGQLQRFSVPLAGGTPQPFLAGKEVKLLIMGSGHRIQGYIDDTATNAGHFFDPAKDQAYQASIRAFPGERMWLHGSSEAFDRLLVATEGPGDAGSWFLINLASHHADAVGYSYLVDSDDVGPMKMLPYTAADGLKMEGVLTLPPPSLMPSAAAKLLPAVILPHGGPFGIYDTAGFDWIAQAFASRGYAVFQPNFRGSGGYGLNFQRAGYGEWGRKMQTDISDGLAELVRQGIVDPQRVCIVGASYGGYAAMAGVTLQQGIYRCSVAYAGLSDLYRLVDDTQDRTDSRMLMRNLNTEIGSGHDLKLVSPIRFADKVSVPMLLIHGKDDTVVDFAQSTRMADALRHAGKVVEFVTLPSEDHWLSKGETRLAMLQASVDFVMKYNPPGPGK